MSKKQPKLKVICGFEEDEKHTIDTSEAHKAYYLFLNPEQRGVFSNGIAVRGKDIKSIKPDYNASMNWNPNYDLDAEDMNHVRRAGVDRLTRKAMSEAKEVARVGKPNIMNMTLQEARKSLDMIEAGSENTHKLPAK